MANAPASLARLQRLSRTFERFTVAGIALVATVPFAIVLVPDLLADALAGRFGAAGTGLEVGLGLRIAAAGILAVPLAVMLWGLMAVRRLFAGFARGQILTEGAAGDLRRFAVAIVLQAPLSPLVTAVLSLVLSAGNPAGERFLTIGLSSTDYFALLVGAVLYAAATVMGEAARLSAENAAFV